MTRYRRSSYALTPECSNARSMMLQQSSNHKRSATAASFLGDAEADDAVTTLPPLPRVVLAFVGVAVADADSATFAAFASFASARAVDFMSISAATLPARFVEK